MVEPCDVEMWSPTIRPWLVFAAQVDVIPLMAVCGVLQVVPPFADERKPTASWVLPEGWKQYVRPRCAPAPEVVGSTACPR